MIEPRRHGVEYSVEHQGDRFVILTNDGARNFRLVVAPFDAPGKESWAEVVPERAGVRLNGTDGKTLREAARATKGKFVSVEDHYPEGGIGAAVLEALAADGGLHVALLAVKGLPTSGKPEELMNAAGIG